MQVQKPSARGHPWPWLLAQEASALGLAWQQSAGQQRGPSAQGAAGKVRAQCRAGQSRAGQSRAGQSRAGSSCATCLLLELSC